MSNALHIVCPSCGGINRVPADKLGAGGKCGKCKQALFQAQPLELTTTNFDHHLAKSDIPLVVDFWAPWCGPCKMMAPVFQQAAQQLEPQVRLVKVNTEQEQALATRFAIRSIPTLAIFRGGQEIARTAGAMDLANLSRWVRQSL